MDIIGPLPTTRSGYKYILTIIDMASRWVEAIPLRRTDAKTVASAFFTEWCVRYGSPSKILTDKGTNFQSDLFKAFCELLGIAKNRTSGYRPQCNGRCEKANGLLKSFITLLGAKYRQHWNLVLPYALYALRQAENQTTGCSAFELIFGQKRPPSMVNTDPKDLKDRAELTKGHADWLDQLCKQLERVRKLAREKEVCVQEKYKSRYDQKTRVKPFKRGDLVLVLVPPHRFVGDKFLPPYEGPFQILDFMEKRKVNCSIQAVNNEHDIRVVNVDSLKLFTPKSVKFADTVEPNVIEALVQDAPKLDRRLRSANIKNKSDHKWLRPTDRSESETDEDNDDNDIEQV